jgi:hypothetical protein
MLYILVNKLLILKYGPLLSWTPCSSMQHRPSWETTRLSSSQEIPCILWNPKVYYGIHKCPPPVPILSQLDPVHNLTTHLLKNHLNIILSTSLAQQELNIQIQTGKFWVLRGNYRRNREKHIHIRMTEILWMYPILSHGTNVKFASAYVPIWVSVMVWMLSLPVRTYPSEFQSWYEC